MAIFLSYSINPVDVFRLNIYTGNKYVKMKLKSITGGNQMKCDNCGQENSDESKFCNNCGTILNNQPIKTEEPQPAVIPAAGTETAAPQINVVKQEARPSSTSMIVFAAINILCCGSFILGVIALVFALMSNSENDIQEAQRKLRIAKTLNIIGIIIGVIKVIIAIILFVMVIIYGNGEFAGYDYNSYF